MWWHRLIRTLLKVVIVLIVGFSTLVLFFPNAFMRYLQVYANRAYLEPIGLSLSYAGFQGDLLGNSTFESINIKRANGALVLDATGVVVNIDIFHLLRRDLSFDNLYLDSLFVSLSASSADEPTQKFNFDRLPWISARDLTVSTCTIRQGDQEIWLSLHGALDMAGEIILDNTDFQLTHPQLGDTLVIGAEQLAFDGDILQVRSGNVDYGHERVRIAGAIRLFPEVNLDVSIYSDTFTRPGDLPKWLEIQSVEGWVFGPLDGLALNVSLGLTTLGEPLDTASVTLSFEENGWRIQDSKFVKGSQRIQAKGLVDFSRGMSIEARFEQARLDEFLPDVPEFVLDGHATFKGTWDEDGLDSLEIMLQLDQLQYQDYMSNGIKGGLCYTGGEWRITDTTHVRYLNSDLQLWGSVNTATQALDLEFYLQTDSMATLMQSIGLAPIAGNVDGQVWASGPLEDLALTGTLMLTGARYMNMSVGQAFIQFVINHTLEHPQGRLYASTGDLNLAGLPAEGAEAEFILEDDILHINSLRIYQGLEKLETRGHISLTDPGYIVFDTLYIARNTEILTSSGLRAKRAGKQIEVSEPIIFEVADGQVSLSGAWESRDNFAVQASLSQFDLERFYRFAGSLGSFTGILTANASVANQNNQLTIAGEVLAVNGQYKRIPYSRLRSEFNLENTQLYLTTLNWYGHEGQFRASGVLDYAPAPDRIGRVGPLAEFDLQGNLAGYEFHELQPWMPWPFDTHGQITGTFHAFGSPTNPIVTADLSIQAPAFDRIKGELLTGRLQYEGEKLSFADLALQTEAGAYSGSGLIPVDLRGGQQGPQLVLDQPVDMALAGTTAQLDFLTPYFDIIDSLNGEFDLELVLSGTFAQLIRNGSLSVGNGKAEILAMENSVMGISGRLALEDNILTVENLTAYTPQEQIGGILEQLRQKMTASLTGTSTGQGRSHLAVSGTMDMGQFFRPYFDLQLVGEHIYFATPLNEIEAIGTAHFEIVGRDTINISGEFVPDPGQLTIHLDLSSQEEPTVGESGSGPLLVYNVRVPFYAGAIVRTNEIDAEIDGEITLTAMGSEDFRYAGTIENIAGNFVLNGHDFTFEEGTIFFDPTEFNPQFNIIAETEIEIPQSSGGEKVKWVTSTVRMLVSGTLEEPNVSFERIPATYTESSLFRLFALGMPTDNGGDPGLASAGWSLGNMILREIEQDTRRMSGLDRFQIQTGGSLDQSRQSSIGIQSIHLGKRLSPRLYIGMQADPTMTFNQYKVVYRLNRNMSLEGGVEDGLYKVGYRIRYRY